MLSGTHTALITPFNADQSVDYECLADLVERQLAAGVDGLVPVGTTGESPTLEVTEHLKVVETVVNVVNGRACVTAGTGANSTAEAVEWTTQAKALGADASLQVTPYYNKPNQEGLYRHFSAVADIGLPVVLYNVPGRTGREIAIETIVRLAKHPNVAVVKEAGGEVDRVSAIKGACDICVLSGDDALAFPMMAVGAAGVISVASNVIPGEVAEMTHHALEGRWTEAAALHAKYHGLFGDLFLDTNPIPVKAALAMMGLTQEVYRLPLCSMSDDLKARLRNQLAGLGLL